MGKIFSWKNYNEKFVVWIFKFTFLWWYYCCWDMRSYSVGIGGTILLRITNVDPMSTTPRKALEQIGANLQRQYERWQPRARYKPLLDPTVEDVKKLCMSLRRNAKVCDMWSVIKLVAAVKLVETLPNKALQNMDTSIIRTLVHGPINS